MEILGMLGSFIGVIPGIILYVIAQEQVQASIATSGIKG